jgi:hypothetical protein
MQFSAIFSDDNELFLFGRTKLYSNSCIRFSVYLIANVTYHQVTTQSSTPADPLLPPPRLSTVPSTAPESVMLLRSSLLVTLRPTPAAAAVPPLATRPVCVYKKSVTGTIGLIIWIAYRDRNAGRTHNREKPTDEAAPPARRGGRGGRGDRQSRTGQT